jgi:hypothetical protein
MSAMRVAYIDIETDYTGALTPDDQEYFRDFKNHRLSVVGIRVVDEERDTFAQLIGPQATRQALLAALTGVEKIVSYNGRSVPDPVKGRVGFDFPVIAAQLGVTLDREFPHDDLVLRCWRNGLYGGLKKVEQTLGLARRRPGRDGQWAMQAWRDYQRTGNRERLEEMLEYNREDVFMLREVERALDQMEKKK